MHQEVHRVILSCLFWGIYPPLKAYLPDAGLKAPIALSTLKAWIASYALLRGAGDHVKEDPLVRTSLEALPVAMAILLVNQDYAILRPFVDSPPRAGRKTGGVGAVVAYTLEVVEPGGVGDFEVGALFYYAGAFVLC